MKKKAIGGAVGLIENGNELAALDYLDVLRTHLATSYEEQATRKKGRAVECHPTERGMRRSACGNEDVPAPKRGGRLAVLGLLDSTRPRVEMFTANVNACHPPKKSVSSTKAIDKKRTCMFMETLEINCFNNRTWRINDRYKTRLSLW